MNKLEIRSPIWKYPRSIGISSTRLTGHQLEIEITYKDKDGVQLYPERYYIDCESARKYPSQIVKGIKLYIIPIQDLGILREVECSTIEQPLNNEKCVADPKKARRIIREEIAKLETKLMKRIFPKQKEILNKGLQSK